MKLRLRRGDSASPVPLTRRALVDLVMATAFVWLAVFVIHRLDLPAGLAEWNASHQDWAIDEFTLVSLCVAVALGIFSWRRWQESVSTIARYRKTLDQLHTTESQIASRDDLIRSVSHELRTPLTAVLGYAELLGSTGLDAPERTEIVDTIIREGRDLSNIVEDLITRARSEAATLEVALVRVSFAGQAAQVLESRSPEDLERIDRKLDSAAIATGDPARVRQILRNLLSNALKYGEGGIEVAAIADDDTVGLSVSNLGPEIPESDREKIFDPYHRVEAEGPKPGGLGLGLAISRQLARMMGGDLEYRYESGRSFFNLSLARYEEPTEPIEPIANAEIPEEAPALEESADTPDEALTAELPEMGPSPIEPQQVPDPSPEPSQDEILDALQASTWIEEIPEAPDAPIWVEEIPDAPQGPTWVEEIRDLAEAPAWLDETFDPTKAPVLTEENPDASEAPVHVGEGPFDSLGFEGQDQRL